MKTFDAVIFDMDGLLINSEELWDTADVVFFEKRNIPLTYEIKRALSGSSLQQGAQWMKEQFALQESVEDIVAERTANTDTIYTRLATPMPGAQVLLETLSKQQLPLAIGSGSSLRRIETIVDRFGWRKYFSTLVSSEHVAYRGKPDPDIYVYAAEHLAIDTERCVVLEDSVNGVLAAKSANMSCIAVPAASAPREDFSLADLIASSLEEKSVYSYLGL